MDDKEISAIEYYCNRYCDEHLDSPQFEYLIDKVLAIIDDATKWRDNALHWKNNVKKAYRIHEAYELIEGHPIPCVDDVDAMRNRIYELEMILTFNDETVKEIFRTKCLDEMGD